VNGPDFLKAKWHVLEQIKLSFDREGIVIPFNQLDIHMDPEALRRIPEKQA
jgi:small conductance mechanosensitive channel